VTGVSVSLHQTPQVFPGYTAKNDQVVAIVDENRIEQYLAAHIVHS
jgi:hypothetical protein